MELRELETDAPPRGRRLLTKSRQSLVRPGSTTVPTFADILCAFYGDNYLKRASLVFGRCYSHVWRLSVGHKRVPRWMLQQIADNADDPTITAELIRYETLRFRARLARRLELRKFAGRWARLFLSGDYEIAVSVEPKRKSRRSKTKKS